MRLKTKKISNLKKIYDGLEDGFYESNHVIRCPLCNENEIIRVLRLKEFRELHENLRIQIINEIKGIDELPLSTITTYGYHNLSVEYTSYVCDKHQTEIVAILAVGEWQPARYQVILLGLFEIRKDT
ncbi:conserved hypothetical protein [Xenorhabdus bovienii str. kraussei Quebec]|uniref:Uncharacterized protein n=1 Tax=Xenorhabdus bovienii str. kraussei Quebec TaxID=1398203 RepID=A0A077PJS5_XENBV|nr:hypothetical protein [Xenorhabdus bovienii]CDH20872.1 conserved hypothetical protein [Xenorhabdus bovienii str. kraussei Quebec]